MVARDEHSTQQSLLKAVLRWSKWLQEMSIALSKASSKLVLEWFVDTEVVEVVARDEHSTQQSLLKACL